MRSFRCMIVDDEPLAIELIEGYIDKIPELNLVSRATNAIEALQILKENDLDLIFFGYPNAPANGHRIIENTKSPPSVIFTTAYREYAVESYELNVVDYLVKPITFIRFVTAVNKFLATRSNSPALKATSGHSESSTKSLFVNVNKKYVKVIFDKIKYIESVKDYIHIHSGDEVIVTKDTITSFEKKLPDNFLRIHRSFIVNRAFITAYTSQDIELGDKELPIGKSYKKEVLERLI